MVTRCLSPLVLALVLAAGAARAEGWTPVAAGAIPGLIADRTVQYDADEQQFRADGRTRYRFLRDRWGWWEVREGLLCFLWPPREDWDCHNVESATGARLRLTPVADGPVLEGRFAE